MGATENILDELYRLMEERDRKPIPGSYTNYLLDKGEDRILLKMGEQYICLLLASKNKDKDLVKNELADLLYHLTVLLYVHNLEWQDIYEELKRRRKDDQTAI